MRKTFVISKSIPPQWWMLNGMIGVFLAYCSILILAQVSPDLIGHLWFLPGIGFLAATIANTSGTGGGVVFIPVFNILRGSGTLALDPTQIVAASFLIQCFGMTTGAFRWTTYLYSQPKAQSNIDVADYWKVIGTVLLFSLPAMLATQHFTRFNPHDVLMGFKAFSIVLGLAVIGTTWTINRTRPPARHVVPLDFFVLAAIGLAGGFITALFSVGVGEIVALYLFIRHYPVVLCTGAAVAISSVSVIVGAPFHIFAGNVVWEVVLLAVPGAVVGGYFARALALWLGPNLLKTLDGLWIVSSSLYLLLANL